MQMFLIVATDANGENMDWFVRAADPISALTYYNSMIHAECMNEPDRKPRVFTVPTNEGDAGCIDWEEVELTL